MATALKDARLRSLLSCLKAEATIANAKISIISLLIKLAVFPSSISFEWLLYHTQRHNAYLGSLHDRCSVQLSECRTIKQCTGPSAQQNGRSALIADISDVLPFVASCIGSRFIAKLNNDDDGVHRCGKDGDRVCKTGIGRLALVWCVLLRLCAAPPHFMVHNRYHSINVPPLNGIHVKPPIRAVAGKGVDGRVMRGKRVKNLKFIHLSINQSRDSSDGVDEKKKKANSLRQ